MSRTDKDEPWNVKLLRLMEEGHLEHEYHSRFKGHHYKRPMKREFPKKDASDIHEFREFLKAENIDFTEEEVEADVIHRREDPADILSPLTRVERKPKTILFSWYEEGYKESEFSELCTDPKHYDPRTGKDTRTGGHALCTPDRTVSRLTPDDYNDMDWDRRATVDHSSTRRGAYREMAKAYNSHGDLDDYEDYYDDNWYY